MLKALIKYIFFIIPIIFITGLSYILFDNLMVGSGALQVQDRDFDRKLKETETLENTYNQE